MTRIAAGLGLALLCAGGAAGGGPKTVLDYYLLLPQTYFEIPREGRRALLKQGGTVIDIPNGYIRSNGDGAQMNLEVCLFRKPDRSYVVAVSNDGRDEGGGETLFHLLVYRNGKWSNVTRSLLPVRVSDALIYKLPRYGRTIRVTNGRGKKQYDLHWTGTRFVKR